MEHPNTYDTVCGQDVVRAGMCLSEGKVVAIPTETVYGLACNAFDEFAVAEVFRRKNRPSFDPLIVHVSSIKDAYKLCASIPEKARILMETFWPGPLTLLLPKTELIPDLVTSGLPSVGLRMPAHPLTLDLLSKLPFPLAAPSANPFGYISPTSAEHVLSHFNGQIPYVLDGGPCTVGVESTIVGFENNTPVIYRLGGITVESISEIIGAVNINTHVGSKPSAPGMLKSHYAPSIPLYIGNAQEYTGLLGDGKGANIVLEQQPHVDGFDTFVLSEKGDPSDAARNLFKVMRQIDNSNYRLVVAEKFPDYGLFRAINDRLARAAAHD
ncbi:MAG: L-threonylcarbamoyladenylate synthase [Bacteroidota bacterium]